MVPKNSSDYTDTYTGVLWEQDVETIDGGLMVDIKKYPKAEPRPTVWVWRNIIIFTFLHISAFYGVYLAFYSAKWQTMVLASFLELMSGLGILAGAHRLWTHRSYKATWPLKLLLIIGNTIAYQNSVYVWVRDHRVHHKYSETDADPHNAKRGFFFAHMGWLMCKKHPQVIEKGKLLDLSDLEADPFVMFQQKYYFRLMFLACIILPILISMYFWNESFSNAWHVAVVLRWIIFLNVTWCVNSVSHMWGSKPYDKNIGAVDNKYTSYLNLGENWHNFHHVFPWDYRSGEHGSHKNLTRVFLDWCAKIGLAYDLKIVSDDVIKMRAQRTGDGTHAIWGWGDKDMSKVEIDSTISIKGN